jgi:hypothetical protein
MRTGGGGGGSGGVSTRGCVLVVSPLMAFFGGFFGVS